MIDITDSNEIIKKAQELLNGPHEKYEPKIDMESIFSDPKKTTDDEFVSANDVYLALSQVEHKLAVISQIDSSKIRFSTFFLLFSAILSILTLVAIL